MTLFSLQKKSYRAHDLVYDIIATSWKWFIVRKKRWSCTYYEWFSKSFP